VVGCNGASLTTTDNLHSSLFYLAPSYAPLAQGLNALKSTARLHTEVRR
jgi:hypothetical protein